MIYTLIDKIWSLHRFLIIYIELHSYHTLHIWPSCFGFSVNNNDLQRLKHNYLKNVQNLEQLQNKYF